jgi:hypothetical protein
MSDPNELSALKASFRGALSAAAALQAMQPAIEALDPATDVSAEVLEQLTRVAAAHAIASAALHGLVETMQARRVSPSA